MMTDARSEVPATGTSGRSAPAVLFADVSAATGAGGADGTPTDDPCTWMLFAFRTWNQRRLSARMREGADLYCVGIILILWFSAEHHHLPFAYHPAIILYSNYIRLERDVVLTDQ